MADPRLFLGLGAGGESGGMSETAVSFRSLLKIRKSTVEFVDVPEFGFAMVTGSGRRPTT